MHFWNNLAFACAAVAQVAHGAPAAAGKPRVTVANGVLVGTTTKLSGATAAASKYVGVPFAASPPLRFGPPKAAPAFTAPYQATTTKPACLQQFPSGEEGKRTKRIFNNPVGNPAPEESEDCLYLNVYVPPLTTQNSSKAVMFWIYGGNLAFGDAGLDAYDGTSMATNQDVVVVTINYRTNVFGFPGAPQLQPPNQNPGFLDQRFALNWVNKNIAHFGGDPKKVTIFGESAGGYSVKQLVSVPPKPLNFRAAIMESEAALNSGNSTLSWEELAAGVGCDTSGMTQLKCMRTVDAQTIVDFETSNSLSFFPVADDITRSSDVKGAFTSGSAAKVPFIIGTNNNEGNVFAYLAGLESSPLTVPQVLAAELPGFTGLQATLAAQLHGNTAYQAASQVITNETFLCPASELAGVAHDNGYDVYRYLYNASFPNFSIFPDAQVYHSTEIPLVFGTYAATPRKPTAREAALSKYMQTNWGNFAKNPAAGPRQGWPELGASGVNGKVRDFGGLGGASASTIMAGKIDVSCPLYDVVIDAQGL